MMNEREMKENPLNEKESLDLIARMIRNAQGRLERGAGAPMLIWGYVTIATTIMVWLAVRHTLDYHYNYVWFLIPVVGSVCMLLRKKQPEGVRTYVDQVVGYIWIVMGVTGFLLSIVSILSVMWNLPILFIIIIIMGMGSTLTGLVTNFKPMVAGGIAGLLTSIPHYLISGYDIKMLTFAFAFVVMYIIPGHILNYKAKKACLKS
ncbi:MAG: hypothetical protein LBG96_08485 [Tannerella sp.]|nr:hypothetical protein [Tannerella sp.]